jgi:hypothetical protein
MNKDEISAQVAIEFRSIEETIGAIDDILKRASSGKVHPSDATAGATYLSQCYNGIENILKRMVRFFEATLPDGPYWHADLLMMFYDNREVDTPVPRLLDEHLFLKLTSLRKFRHVVFHGYSIKFEWDLVKENLQAIADTVRSFKKRLDIVTPTDK